ncbi:XTP/dITP diphosphatase [Bacillus marinisedimentorum]|uniref:XTP/dITP diphosphatase n=1 Tax=Bacillus marinisedimentorum TaxID=1821260 RepID=UPI0007DF4E56|nr:XTP/dITP diphosphatase [Bacillus marinisedimentorum]
MEEIIIATKNKGKVKDFEALLSKRGIQVRSLHDFPDMPDVEETGSTFEENAILKAETIARKLGRTVIADDSGLIVDYLDGRPGVYSARYAGEEKNDRANLEKVLAELEGVPEDERTARFYCVLAVSVPDEEPKVAEGTCEGLIARKPQGEHGFGYDPIFFVKEKNKTMGQLTKEEKNKISHRAAAMEKLDANWDEYFNKR